MTNQLIPSSRIPPLKVVNTTSKPTQKWEIRKIKSNVWKDELQLQHWEKVNTTQKLYAYDELNIKMDILRYTDEQYDLLIEPLAKDWSRDETDELFELYDQFDGRFVVIHDKFSNQDRCVEDLKKRFYEVSRVLMEFSAFYSKKVEYQNHPILRTPYDYGIIVLFSF